MAFSEQIEKFYQVELNKTTWKLPERYQNLSRVATGAYGQVCSAYDTLKLKNVAIKKFCHPFQSSVHAKRTCREIRMLRYMNHENIINLLDAFTPQKNLAAFKDVYIVTTLMGADLSKILEKQHLSDEHVQFLVYQILRGLKYVHSAEITHRDLKPQNIAINEDCELRILDFGLARVTDNEMTGYVITRWYRSPEIMLNWRHYNGKSADMWSVGCIMAEMILDRPIFKGDTSIDQLNKIFGIMGKPNEEFIKNISGHDAQEYVRALPNHQALDFKHYFAGASPLAIDLLSKMLILDADKRITAKEALTHPYLVAYADPTDEPNSMAFEDPYENQEMSIEDWKRVIFEELKPYHELRLHQLINPSKPTTSTAGTS